MVVFSSLDEKFFTFPLAASFSISAKKSLYPPPLGGVCFITARAVMDTSPEGGPSNAFGCAPVKKPSPSLRSTIGFHEDGTVI